MYTTFKSANEHYVYDTWSNKILHIDSRMFHVLNAESLDKLKSNPEYVDTFEELEKAKKTGLFSLKTPKIKSFPEDNLDEFLNKHLSKGPSQLILGITEQCNLRCRYCAYSGLYETERTHSEKRMPLSMAKNVIDWYLSFDRDEYSIGFYGGEPLLEKDKIKKIINYVKSKTDRKIIYSLTTNATLIDDDILNLLVDNNVRLTVSLDGPPDVHDRYRVFKDGKGSFDIIFEKLSIIKKKLPDYYSNISFNIVMAPPYKLSEIRTFISQYPELFEDNSIRINQMNTAHKEMNIFEQTDMRSYAEDQKKIYKNFCDSIVGGKRAETLSNSFFQDRFLHIHKRSMCKMKDKTATHGQCIPGLRKCYVDTEGYYHMCERVNSAFPIGHVSDGFDYKSIANFLKAYDKFFKEDCSKCWAVRFCGKCYNNFKSIDGWSSANMLSFCDSKRRDIKYSLSEYCRLRQDSEGCFDWIDDVVIS